MNEFSVFGVGISVFKYWGNQEERRQLQNQFHHQCLITSYEIVLKDSQYLEQFQWELLIVDEAHRLKNENSVLYNALFQMQFPHKILMTGTLLIILGTPIQNNLLELHALLHFLHPDIFNQSAKEFESMFGPSNKNEKQALMDLNQLKSIIDPFILRKSCLNNRSREETHLKITTKKRTYFIYRNIQLTKETLQINTAKRFNWNFRQKIHIFKKW